MAIRGFLESVSGTAIRGWCIDTSDDGVVDVEIRIGSISLGSVHADLYRRDLDEKWNRTGGGFRFQISPQLLSLLPARERVAAFANGHPLRCGAQCDPYIENSEADGEGKLGQLLADGFFISPKSGSVHRPVRDRWSTKRILDSIARSNSVFESLFGRNLFICYGTLLGAIRSDDFIAQDDDVDVCFLSDRESAEGAAEDFEEVIRALREEGEKVKWPGNAHFHWNLTQAVPHGAGALLDVFVAWYEDGKIYLYNAGGTCTQDAVIPLRQHSFKGRQVFVPNDPERILELIYGPDWRTPDPMFQWRVQPDIRENLRRFEERLHKLPE